MCLRIDRVQYFEQFRIDRREKVSNVWSNFSEGIWWFLNGHRMNTKCVVSSSFSNLFEKNIVILCDVPSAAYLDAMREKTVHGDRQVYHTITDVRSTIIVILYFSIATGVGSLELTAKTKRPREKSFIRPISQIANEVGSPNPRMTSEVRKCLKRRFFGHNFFQVHLVK